MPSPVQMCVFLFFGTISMKLSAQPIPDSNLWTEVNNPSGERVVPLIVYDQISGVVLIDTLGQNRVDETPDYTAPGGPILGDDVGLIGVRINTLIDGGEFFKVFNSFSQQLSWNSSRNGSSYVTTGTEIGNNSFLWPGQYGWLQLPTGLTQDDFFGFVEIEVSFGPNTPGDTVIAQADGITIVPEPATLRLAIASIVLLHFVGRRSGNLASKPKTRELTLPVR